MLLSGFIDRKKRISAFNSAYFTRKYCCNFTVFCQYSLCWAWTTASISRLGRIIMRIPLILLHLLQLWCIYKTMQCLVVFIWQCECVPKVVVHNKFTLCVHASKKRPRDESVYVIFEFVITVFLFIFPNCTDLSFSRLTYAELQNWRKKIRCD